MSEKAAPQALSARAAAAFILTGVIKYRRSLDACLAVELAAVEDPRERSLTQALCYGVLRSFPRLRALLDRLVEKQLRTRDTDVTALLLLGLHQLSGTRIPPHAAVTETVSATRTIGKPWAAGLINAVLRRYQDQKHALEAELEVIEESKYAHPDWLIARIRQAWPDTWKRILVENNRHPPMTLRVNRRMSSRGAYLSTLAVAGIAARTTPHTSHGITLQHPVNVSQLPGFEQGMVSVQDGAAQLAASLLETKPGHRVLDACAAPGGKTAHILERCAGHRRVSRRRTGPETRRAVTPNPVALKSVG